MDNNTVIEKLKECVNKLVEDTFVMETKRDSLPNDTPAEIQQGIKLNNLISKMIAEKNSLEAVINEREAINSTFPPLDDRTAAKFLFQMNILNLVIQADQHFDQIVAIANGIRGAADEIEKITE